MSNPAAEARAKVRAAHPEATVWQRRRNTLKHRLADAPDGKRRYALDCFIGPIHYGPDADQEIDTAFVPSTAPWSWEMTRADFEVRALSRLDAGQVVEYRDGEEWVRFQPMALQYSNALDQIQQIAMPGQVDAAVDDDTLTWADGYGAGIDISWQAQTARLAKRLTIRSPDALPPAEQYILDGGEPCLELNFIFAYSKGVTPYVNGELWDGKAQVETQALVEFRDGEGNVLWWFNLPRSWDAEGEEQLGTFRFRKVGNALYVSHRVPLGFVQAAAYPLTVDVDVDKQVAASGDDGYAYAYNETLDTGGTPIQVGYNFGGYHAFCRWTGVTIEGTIGVSYIEVYRYAAAAGTPERRFYGVDEDNPAAPTTYAEFGADPLTTASVEWDGEWGAQWNQSPSLNTIFQELVDTYAISNEAVMVQLKDDVGSGTHWQACRSYDYSGNAHGPKLHIEYTAGAAPQTLLPSGIASLEAFGAATLSPGAVSLQPSAIASAEGFGTAKVNLILAASAIASVEAFGTPQLNLTAFPSAIASLEAFGTLKVNLTVFPSAIASLEAFGTPTLSPGVVVLAPDAIASLEAFGSPTVVGGAMRLFPSAIASLEAFGEPTLAPGAVTLLPSGIASLEAFGTLMLVLTVAPSGIASEEAFGTLIFLPGAVIIVASGIASAEAFGAVRVIGGMMPVDWALVGLPGRASSSLPVPGRAGAVEHLGGRAGAKRPMIGRGRSG